MAVAVSRGNWERTQHDSTYLHAIFVDEIGMFPLIVAEKEMTSDLQVDLTAVTILRLRTHADWNKIDLMWPRCGKYDLKIASKHMLIKTWLCIQIKITILGALP